VRAFSRTLPGAKSEDSVAQFHMSVKAIGRSAGRSATAAAAYRSAEKIVDLRTGEVHDYTHKRGVMDSALVLPGGESANRAELWNAVEQHHSRGDAVLAREFTLALPHEMPEAERARLAFDYGRELADRYGVAVDVCLHEPDKGGDNRNYHAHVMMSACHVGPDGTPGKKAVELDPIHCARARTLNFAERERPRWAALHNARMAELGLSGRIDHRTLEAQGIDREPTQHLGVAATGFERRTGLPSALRFAHEAEANERLLRAAELGRQERGQAKELDRGLVMASSDVSAALAERDKLHQVRNVIAEARPSWASLRVEVGQDRQRIELERQQREQQQRLERQRLEREQARQVELDRIGRQYPKLMAAANAQALGLSGPRRDAYMDKVIENVRAKEKERSRELQRDRGPSLGM
jgi:hypothetical protein